MNIKAFLSLALLIPPAEYAAELPSQFNGLGGASLRAAVADEYTPVTPGAEVIDMKGGRDVTEYFDPFVGGVVDATGWHYGMIVPDSWLEGDAPVDMYNLLMLSGETDAARKDYPVGKVDNPAYDNGIWRAGTTVVAGLPIGFYEPPTNFRGDFARVFFYYVAVHSPRELTPRGYTMLDGSMYPAFTPYAMTVLMDYHRSDPVSDDELRRVDMISSVQGNRNPFVDYPVLAEYLWGDRRDEVVEIPGEPVALRGTYRLSDERIDLVSNYVPDDAAWSVDGKSVAGNYLVPARLGKGKHQLRYTTPSGAAGMLTINITD
ncbi:MAG: endonuclease [Duncaniella sp.]|nr:endonuclease [Duncaniella sp.]